MPKTILSGGKTHVKGIKNWIIPILIGFLIAIIGGWGFSAILTHQSFDFYIDIQSGQIHFIFGKAEVVLPYPAEIKEDGRAYINDIPLRNFLESQGYTVEWRDGEIFAWK